MKRMQAHIDALARHVVSAAHDRTDGPKAARDIDYWRHMTSAQCMSVHETMHIPGIPIHAVFESWVLIAQPHGKHKHLSWPVLPRLSHMLLNCDRAPGLAVVETASGTWI